MYKAEYLKSLYAYHHRRRLRGDWGDAPQKIRGGGDGQCIRSPNILRSSVIGCVSKYEPTKKRCHEGMFCSEIEVFWQEKGHMCYIISDLQQRQEKDRQNMVDD